MKYTLKSTFKPISRITLLIIFILLFKALAQSAEAPHRAREKKNHAPADSTGHLFTPEEIDKQGKFNDLSFAPPHGSEQRGIGPMPNPEALKINFAFALESPPEISDKKQDFQPFALGNGGGQDKFTLAQFSAFPLDKRSAPSPEVMESNVNDGEREHEASKEISAPAPERTEEKSEDICTRDEDEVDGIRVPGSSATKEEPDFLFAHFDDTLFVGGKSKAKAKAKEVGKEAEDLEWDTSFDIGKEKYKEDDEAIFDTLSSDSGDISTPHLTSDTSDSEDDGGMDEVDNGRRPKFSPVTQAITHPVKPLVQGKDVESIRPTWTFFNPHAKDLESVNNGDQPERMVQLKKTETVIQREQESLISQELQGKLAQRLQGLDPAPETVQVQTLSTLEWKVHLGSPLTAKAHPQQYDTPAVAAIYSKKRPPVQSTTYKSKKDDGDKRDFLTAKSTNNGQGHTFGRSARPSHPWSTPYLQ